MYTIEIDESTYRFLQARALAFIEDPGDTIKRLLDVEGSSVNLPADKNNISNSSNYVEARQKKKKTNLPRLIRAGLLKDGQKLTFQDYKGNRYPEYEVVLSGTGLIWRKKSYSMSALAKRLLKEKGYMNDFVRGPIFWVTDEGRTIAEIWDKYLEEKSVDHSI